MIPLKDSHPANIFPFWTIAIIVANVYVFWLELTAPDPEAFIRAYALIPSQINFLDYPSLLPFITSQFVHGGFIHIISNMLFLWVFGDNVEGRFGFFRFPIFYLLAGVVGGFAQYIFAINSSLPMLGASGAVAGVLGAYFVMFPKHTVKTLVPVFGFLTIINIPAWFMLIYWFLTQVFAGVATISVGAAGIGGIAWFAHIGGFITGLLVGSQNRYFENQYNTT